MINTLELPHCWESALASTLSSKPVKELDLFLQQQYEQGKRIYPEKENIFAAFRATKFEDVKVVIIGQDPYHGEGQAHGLSFSVQRGIAIPPSLRNIYKEIESDLGLKMPQHGDLSAWAKQGVLLLNNVLTVEHSKAGSHQKKGWEYFTDAVIEALAQKEHLVYLLWGSPAQKKAKNVDEEKNLVLKSVHPSPLSSYRGFFGCKHFSKTNEYLKAHGLKEIDWAL